MTSSKSNLFGAIFDWDGVIIDSAKLHEQSWHALARELRRTIVPGSFLRGFGMKSAQIIRGIHGWSDDPAEISRLTNRKEALYREFVRQYPIAPLPGVVEWLQQLQEAAIPCAIASSTPRLNIEVVLDRLGLTNQFDAIVAAEDVEQGKPNPEVFLKAAAKLGLPPERCVVFEDAQVGLQAAHAGGMKAIAVTTTHSPDELAAADLVVHRLDELTPATIAKLLSNLSLPNE